MEIPFTVKLIEKIALDMNAKVLVEPEFKLVSHIQFDNGKRIFLYNTNLNINGSGSSRISKDKGYTLEFLKRFNFNVTHGQTFFNDRLCEITGSERNIDAGCEFGRQLGYPFIVKPNDQCQGILVTKVHNESEYYEAARKIFDISQVMLVQKYYSGNDFRIVVLDGEVAAAYKREPFFVVGNGKSNIRELIELKLRDIQKSGRRISIDVNDYRMLANLKRQSMSLESVCSQDSKVYLFDNANLSSGGDAVDLSESIHPDFSRLAVEVTNEMGLAFCGLDILSDDITVPISQSNYVILEVNSSPGMANFASLGEEQLKKVEDIYRRILVKMRNQ